MTADEALNIGGWTLAGVLVVLLLWAVISLLRSPLDERRRLVWVLAVFILPGVGALAWLWWRYSYYPKRRREQPDWDPNSRDVQPLQPQRLTKKRY